MRLLRAITFLICVIGSAQEYRAFWADAFHPGYKTPSEVDQMVADVASAKGNAIVVEVRNRGGAYFLKSIEPPVEDAAYSAGFDALEYLIAQAHARGIEVHAWYPVTPLWPLAKPPVDPRHAWNLHGPSAKAGDMWMTMTASGKISSSVDPGHPDALRYLANVIVDPATKYDLDGLHLDYIRYPEDDNYGWNPKAVERFNRLNNRGGSPAASDPAWSDFRRMQVSALVRQVYLRAMEIKPSLKITAALITWGDGPANDDQFRTKDAYSRVFQDWRGWLEEGILDIGMPMNYFRNPVNSSFLDHWIAYEKDRQYRRSVVIGTAAYLNSIPDSLTQLARVKAPSQNGNVPLGVIFYSYSSTNTLNSMDLPSTPNAEFYKAVADTFGNTATVPALPWKTTPDRGYVLGTVNIADGPAWLNDGAGVTIESDTGKSTSLHVTTDGTGFFGAVDLIPDRYRIRLQRGGVEVFRTVAQDVRAGAATRFDLFLKAADFAQAVPRLAASLQPVAAPGELVTIDGSALAAAYAPATAVPLPLEIGGTQVLVNGVTAALSYVDAGSIEFQMPFMKTDVWNVVVRRAGMESTPVQIGYADAHPVIKGTQVVEGRYLIIYATGLGMTLPILTTGTGGNPQEPFNRTLLPVSVNAFTQWFNAEFPVLYAGMAPYQPALFQVNVQLPEGMRSGEVVLRVGDASVNVRF
jgi:uncharacterized protein (TIGR03437 family)